MGWSQWGKRAFPSFPVSTSQPSHAGQGAKSGEFTSHLEIFIFPPRDGGFLPHLAAGEHGDRPARSPAARLRKRCPRKTFTTDLQLGKLRHRGLKEVL